MADHDLAGRVHRLEAIEAIRQLKARYCEICDDDHNPDEIVKIFTPDGTWEGRGVGRAEGHEQLRTLFAGFRDAISFSQHMVSNPVIDVQGMTATGRWYFFGLFKMRKNGRALWQACRYHETYRCDDDDHWRISSLKVAPPTLAADYQKGW